jgi:peptidoglycan/xylan/chitin deacetylase (PgdA/CDA1 family)
VIPTYHEITEDSSSYSYSVTVAQFAAHAAVIAKQRPPVRSLPRITFDDGVQSQFRHALPILRQHSLAATFFVNTGLIGVVPEYMTWAQLEETFRLGHRVQSHGWSHACLPECSDVQLDEELRRSKGVLEERLGTAVDEISMPNGRWDRRVLEACARAGYRRAYLSDPWARYAANTGVEVVGRLMVRATMTSEQLEGALNARGVTVLLSRARYQTKEQIKRLLGHGLYHRLWLALSGYNKFAENHQRTPELDFRQRPR